MARIRSMIAAACLAVGTVSVTACSSLPDEIDRAEIDADFGAKIGADFGAVW